MYFLVLFPFFGALIGWAAHKILTLLITSIIVNKKHQIAKVIAAESADLFDLDELSKKFTSREAIAALEPKIAAQMDDFLDHRLQQKLPMLSMFAGDKIMVQIKDVFMQEIQNLLPTLLREHAEGLKSKANIGAAFGARFNEVPNANLAYKIKILLRPAYAKLQMFGALLGFVMGVIFIIAVFVYYFLFLR